MAVCNINNRWCCSSKEDIKKAIVMMMLLVETITIAIIDGMWIPKSILILTQILIPIQIPTKTQILTPIQTQILIPIQILILTPIQTTVTLSTKSIQNRSIKWYRQQQLISTTTTTTTITIIRTTQFLTKTLTPPTLDHHITQGQNQYNCSIRRIVTQKAITPKIIWLSSATISINQLIQQLLIILLTNSVTNLLLISKTNY